MYPSIFLSLCYTFFVCCPTDGDIQNYSYVSIFFLQLMPVPAGVVIPLCGVWITNSSKM